MAKRDKFTTPIQMEEKIFLPKVWITVLILVGAGILLHLMLWIWSIGGLLIWPFIFAVCVLLIISDAAESSGGGVKPTAAYTAFFATLVAMFGFVILVSKTINWWVLLIAIGVMCYYLAKDWKQRREREREIERRRAAHLCLRCMHPVTDGIEDICENCGLPVNPERMNLFRLGKAIQNKNQKDLTRKVLMDAKPTKADAKFQAKQMARAASYRKKK
jgi:hypothetical protein